MDHPTLHDTMTKDVLARCEAILGRARREAESIVAEARRLAAEQREKAIARAQADAERVAEEARSRAGAQALLAGRSVRQQVLYEVLKQAGDDLSHLAGTEDFVPVLEALLAEAIACVKDAGTVKAPPNHVERVRQWLAERGLDGARVEGKPSLNDGVVVEDKDRTIRVTNTLSQRLANLWPQARQHCHGLLFGDGER